MKELELNKKDEVVIVDEKQVKKQLQYLKSINPHKGHKVFEWNLITNDMQEAEMEAVPFDVKEKNNVLMPHKKIVKVKQNCYYTSALNFKNAAKHFFKMIDNQEKQTSHE